MSVRTDEEAGASKTRFSQAGAWEKGKSSLIPTFHYSSILFCSHPTSSYPLFLFISFFSKPS
jgi:hypothetical protein